MPPAPGHFVVTPNEGLPRLFEDITNPTGPRVPWLLMLIAADFAADPTLGLNGYTEASFAGYTRWSIHRAQWNAPTISDGCAEATWGTDPINWTSSGPSQTVYGVAYIDQEANALVRVEHFATADVFTVDAGQMFTLTPGFSLTGAEC